MRSFCSWLPLTRDDLRKEEGKKKISGRIGLHWERDQERDWNKTKVVWTFCLLIPPFPMNEKHECHGLTGLDEETFVNFFPPPSFASLLRLGVFLASYCGGSTPTLAPHIFVPGKRGRQSQGNDDLQWPEMGFGLPSERRGVLKRDLERKKPKAEDDSSLRQILSGLRTR